MLYLDLANLTPPLSCTVITGSMQQQRDGQVWPRPEMPGVASSNGGSGPGSMPALQPAGGPFQQRPPPGAGPTPTAASPSSLQQPLGQFPPTTGPAGAPRPPSQAAGSWQGLVLNGTARPQASAAGLGPATPASRLSMLPGSGLAGPPDVQQQATPAGRLPGSGGSASGSRQPPGQMQGPVSGGFRPPAGIRPQGAVLPGQQQLRPPFPPGVAPALQQQQQQARPPFGPVPAPGPGQQQQRARPPFGPGPPPGHGQQQQLRPPYGAPGPGRPHLGPPGGRLITSLPASS